MKQQENTQAERRIQALQTFVNDQCFSTISFCQALPFGGEKLLEQMLRQLAEYHTENSLNSDLFLKSHHLPEKKFSPEAALSFVVNIHIKEGFMARDWFRVSREDKDSTFSVEYKKESCFYFGHCNKLVCDGYICVCVRRFFYEGIIKRLTGENYSSTLFTKKLDEEYCRFGFNKAEKTADEVKKYQERVYGTYEENSRLNEAVKFRTRQLEIRNKHLQSEITSHKITGNKLKEARDKLRKAHTLMEEKVKERTLQLEFANKELEAFNYMVSHDLRAPLRHISGFSRLLQKELGPNINKNIDEYASIIVTATDNMDRLINDLLDYSKAGSLKIKKVEVGLSAIIQEILTESGPDIKGRKITWITPELPAIDGDPNLIKLVLTNLISNALKYTGKRESATIETGSFTTDDNATVFFIKDNGTGFDMKFKESLFDPFKRLHDPGDFEGSGLGLSNVKRIIDLHGGSIWAESVVDEGATFYFTLPVHRA